MEQETAVSRALSSVHEISMRYGKSQMAGSPADANPADLAMAVTMSVAATLVAVVLKAPPFAVMQDQDGNSMTVADIINQCLAFNEVGYRLVLVQ